MNCVNFLFGVPSVSLHVSSRGCVVKVNSYRTFAFDRIITSRDLFILCCIFVNKMADGVDS